MKSLGARGADDKRLKGLGQLRTAAPTLSSLPKAWIERQPGLSQGCLPRGAACIRRAPQTVWNSIATLCWVGPAFFSDAFIPMALRRGRRVSMATTSMQKVF